MATKLSPAQAAAKAAARRAKPAVVPASTNPAAFNMTGKGQSKPFEYTANWMANMPSRGDLLPSMRDPSGAYSNVKGGADSFLSGAFDWRPNGAGSNRFLDEGGDYLRGGGGAQPSAPGLYGPGSYARPGDPSFNYTNRSVDRFDPRSVVGPSGGGNYRGPSVDQFDFSSVRSPSGRGDYSGPSYNMPEFDYNSLLSGAYGGGGNAAVPRETLRGSGYNTSEEFSNPESVSRRGFDLGLKGAEAAQNAGFNSDIYKKGEDAAKKSLAALRLYSDTMGQEDVGGRGIVYDPSTGVSQEAFAKYYAQPAAEIGKELVNMSERQASEAARTREAGTGFALQAGSQAANAAQGFGGLSQSEAERLQSGGITMRGQDIDLEKFNIGESGANYGRTLAGVADLLRAETGAREGMFRAGTERGSAQDDSYLRGYGLETDRGVGYGGVFNEGQRNRTDAYRAGSERGNMQDQTASDFYRAQTERIGTEGDIADRYSGRSTDQFRAETDRAQVEQAARAEAARLGYDYDSLGAQERDQFNQRANDRLQIEGNLGNERYRDTLRGYGDFAGIENDRQNQAEARNLEYMLGMSENSLEVMRQSQNGDFYYNTMLDAMRQGDIDTAMQMIQIWVQDQQEGKQRRDASRGAIAGGVANLVGSVAGGVIGASGGGGSAAGYSGMPRQSLSYGGR